MGEAKRRRQAVAAGLHDPGAKHPNPTSYRWGERKQLAAALVAQTLEQGKPLPPHLHPMAVQLLRAAEKLRKKAGEGKPLGAEIAAPEPEPPPT